MHNELELITSFKLFKIYVFKGRNNSLMYLNSEAL